MTRFAAPISEQIWDMKYRFKDANDNPIDETVEDTWDRIANALAAPEEESDHTGRNTQAGSARLFYEALEDFKFLPAGRITAGAGTARTVTLFNCFVMGTVPDSMSGIFDMLKEAALTMQQGGGIGYDFSTIRPKSSWVKGVDSDASGPLSFMDCWDAMCRTVMSAGSRRGAMMATMRCDHPDILDFIRAKQDAGRLRMFNLSVLATDAFMEAVKNGDDWPLVHTQPPKEVAYDAIQHATMDGSQMISTRDDGLFVHSVVNARELWHEIMMGTYAAAEPGVIFIDRINQSNNLRYIETIAATNPCGEQPLPPYGACLLGSINLAKLVHKPFTSEAHIDGDELDNLVATAVRMMDNVVDVSGFPLIQQQKEAEAKRRIGLGVTGLANTLAMMCLRYGSEAAVARTESIMKRIAIAAYRASVELAKEKGPFPLFQADEFLAEGTHASTLPKDLQEAIREHGIRNALLTSIAPTGTISLYGGNVSSGIEPPFAYSFTRKVLQKDGTKTEELVEDYAVAMYRKMWERGEFEPKPEKKLIPFDTEQHLPPYFTNAQMLKPRDHLVMQAAAQKWVDSSISKTINCPEDITFDDFQAIYMEAYESGCKGCTTYRPNEITGSVLSVEPKKEEVPKEGARIEDNPDGPENQPHIVIGDQTYNLDRAQVEAISKARLGGGMMYEPVQPSLDDLMKLPNRPDELEGSTYKIKVGDQKAVYLTINDMVESDGTVRPFEIFLRSSDPAHDEWMVTVARLVSAIMRRPHDASFIGPELMRVTSAVTGGFQKGYGYQPSLVAAIGRKIKEHAEHTSFMTTTPNENSGNGDFDLEEALDDSIPEFETKGPMCRNCNGHNVKVESGCATCLDCGDSKCG